MISGETPINVRTPLVVIAPDEIVLIFVKLPIESILVVPFVCTSLVALRVNP